MTALRAEWRAEWISQQSHSKGNRRPGYYLGHDSFQVTGDGHGGQPFGCQPFSLQPPEPGCQLPMAERPAPELSMPVPVTRHHGSL